MIDCRIIIGIRVTSNSLVLIVLVFSFFPAYQNVGNAQDIYQISTYDDPRYEKKGELRHQQIENHEASLKKMADRGLFDTLNARSIINLPSNHREYFRTHSAYKLLFSSTGDLFGNRKADWVFIVYDRQNMRISILLYNNSTDQYGELYREIKVENGLASAKCNYFAFGTLDYQIGDEVLYMKQGLTKRPDTFYNLEFCKCADISIDPDLADLSGCFAKGFERNNVNGFTSLCIAKSFVYNSWECLKYDANKNIFIIFYGQASAD